MNKMLRYCFLFSLFLAKAAHIDAQVVFTDDFTAPLAGFPPPGYAISGGNTDITPGSANGMQIGGSAGSIVFTPDQLASWVSVATVPLGLTNNGYSQAAGLLSGYSAPFNTTLDANTHIISWHFNMQSGTLATGFSDGRDDAAVILACDNPDFRNAGNGYAVTYQPFIPGGVQLIKYSGGLLGVVTPIVSSGVFLSAATNYTSFEVTYDPGTDTWDFSGRDDGAIAFTDPMAGGPYTSFGSLVDATYTSTAMTHFGFYANYSVKYLAPADPDVINAYFDNFSVRMICADPTGVLTTCIGGYTTLSHILPGGTWSSSAPGIASVPVATMGEIRGVSPGTATINYTTGSCAVSAIVTVSAAVITPITGDTMLCRMDNSFLSATPVGGAWSNYHTTFGTIDPATGLYTSLVPGTDTVVYEAFSGCNTRRTVHIDSAELIFGVAGVCVGSNMTMTNAIVGGTWSSSATSVFTVNATSGVVTGISPATTATISYVNPYGCTATTGVTVYALPTALTGDMHICVGTTSTLTSTPAGGTWSSSSGNATINPSTGEVTGAANGTSTITYTEASSPVACIRTAVVTVDPAPAAITGTATMCANSSQTLSHAVSGGTWSTSNAAVATVNSSGNVTGVITTGGTATITYTLPSGCTVTQVVTVLALPNTITGPLNACVTGTTTLNTTTGGATWTSSNTGIATVGGSSGVVTGVAAGTVNITTTGPNGCSRSVVVTVNNLPAGLTGTATVCVAATTVLSSTTSGGTWSSSNSFVASVAGGTVSGVSGGTATITYTVNSCITTRIVTVNNLPNTITGPTDVCINATITLNSSPAGTWSSSNAAVGTIGAANGVVGGITAGTTNVTYVIANGCQRVRTITVDALPPAIGGPLLLCPGSSATLTNTAAGTWQSSNPAAATIVSASGAYTGISAGTSNITFTQTSTGCMITAVVTIAPAPPAIITPIGDTMMCPGDFVTLSVSTSAGVTYRWYNGAGIIPGATSPVYVATTAGSYRAEVLVVSGCSSISSPMSVTISPATATITVSGATSTCAGTPVALNANVGPGLTYQWQLGGSPIAGATAATYNAGISGSYAVRVTNSAGCWAVSTPVSVSVSPVPSNAVTASGPLTICDGSNVTLTAASGAGYTYQWFDGTGPIAGATSQSYAATTAESYYVTVTNAAGCTATSTLSVVVVNPLPNVAINPGGPTIFCAGNNVLLDAAPGFAYQWYNSGVPISGATNPFYLATTSGGYRVRVTIAATGCSDITHADTVVAALMPATVIALSPATFCWGGSALLSTSLSSYGTYLTYRWYFNGSPIPGGINPTHNAGSVGNYHCQVTVPGSCTFTTTATAVSSVPLPSPTVIASASSMYTASYYVSYQWYKDLAPIPGATAYATPITGNGNYKVAVTDTNGCQSVSLTYVLTNWGGPTGVMDINNPEIKIYPSPAKQVVNIESSVNVRAVISSIDGKVLINQPNARIIGLNGIADGIYIITLFNDDGQLVKTEKLVKQQ